MRDGSKFSTVSHKPHDNLVVTSPSGSQASAYLHAHEKAQLPENSPLQPRRPRVTRPFPPTLFPGTPKDSPRRNRLRRFSTKAAAKSRPANSAARAAALQYNILQGNADSRAQTAPQSLSMSLTESPAIQLLIERRITAAALKAATHRIEDLQHAVDLPCTPLHATHRWGQPQHSMELDGDTGDRSMITGTLAVKDAGKFVGPASRQARKSRSTSQAAKKSMSKQTLHVNTSLHQNEIVCSSPLYARERSGSQSPPLIVSEAKLWVKLPSPDIGNRNGHSRKQSRGHSRGQSPRSTESRNCSRMGSFDDDEESLFTTEPSLLDEFTVDGWEDVSVEPSFSLMDIVDERAGATPPYIAPGNQGFSFENVGQNDETNSSGVSLTSNLEECGEAEGLLQEQNHEISNNTLNFKRKDGFHREENESNEKEDKHKSFPEQSSQQRSNPPVEIRRGRKAVVARSVSVAIVMSKQRKLHEDTQRAKSNAEVAAAEARRAKKMLKDARRANEEAKQEMRRFRIGVRRERMETTAIRERADALKIAEIAAMKAVDAASKAQQEYISATADEDKGTKVLAKAKARVGSQTRKVFSNGEVVKIATESPDNIKSDQSSSAAPPLQISLKCSDISEVSQKEAVEPMAVNDNFVESYDDEIPPLCNITSSSPIKNTKLCEEGRDARPSKLFTIENIVSSNEGNRSISISSREEDEEDEVDSSANAVANEDVVPRKMPFAEIKAQRLRASEMEYPEDILPLKSTKHREQLINERSPAPDNWDETVQIRHDHTSNFSESADLRKIDFNDDIANHSGKMLPNDGGASDKERCSMRDSPGELHINTLNRDVCLDDGVHGSPSPLGAYKQSLVTANYPPLFLGREPVPMLTWDILCKLGPTALEKRCIANENSSLDGESGSQDAIFFSDRALREGRHGTAVRLATVGIHLLESARRSADLPIIFELRAKAWAALGCWEQAELDSRIASELCIGLNDSRRWAITLFHAEAACRVCGSVKISPEKEAQDGKSLALSDLNNMLNEENIPVDVHIDALLLRARVRFEVVSGGKILGQLAVNFAANVVGVNDILADLRLALEVGTRRSLEEQPSQGSEVVTVAELNYYLGCMLEAIPDKIGEAQRYFVQSIRLGLPDPEPVRRLVDIIVAREVSSGTLCSRREGNECTEGSGGGALNTARDILEEMGKMSFDANNSDLPKKRRGVIATGPRSQRWMAAVLAQQGRIHILMGAYKRAEKVLQNAAELDTTCFEAFIYCFRLFSDPEATKDNVFNLEKAQECLNAAGAIAPNAGILYAMQAELDMLTGNHTASLESLVRVTTVEPKHYFAWLEQARLQLRHFKDGRAAAAAATTALQCARTCDRDAALELRSEAYVLQGDLDRAVFDCSSIIHTSPVTLTSNSKPPPHSLSLTGSSTLHYLRRGRLLVRQRRAREALHDFIALINNAAAEQQRRDDIFEEGRAAVRRTSSAYSMNNLGIGNNDNRVCHPVLEALGGDKGIINLAAVKGKAFSLLGCWDRAAAEYKLAVDAEPTIDNLCKLCEAMQATGDDDGAQNTVQMALSLLKGDGSCGNQLGEQDEDGKNIDGDEGVLSLARAFKLMGDYDRALSYFDLGIEKCKVEKALHHLHAKQRAAIATDNIDTVDSDNHTIQAAFSPVPGEKSGRHGKKKKKGTAIFLPPQKKSHSAQNGILVRTPKAKPISKHGFKELRDHDLGDKDFDECLKRNPFNWEAILNRAEVQLMRGDIPSAITTYGTLLAHGQTHRQQKYNTTRGRRTSAAASTNKDIMKNQKPSLTFENSRSFDQSETVTETVDCALPKSIKLQALLCRGSLHYELQRYSDAIADFDSAIEIDGSSSNAWFNRGATYHTIHPQHGVFAEAISQALHDYSCAIELDPSHAFALRNRGLLYCDQGRYKHALQDLLQAQELLPDGEEVASAVALCQSELGNHDDAIATSLLATKGHGRSVIGPPALSDLIGLGSAYLNRGRQLLEPVRKADLMAPNVALTSDVSHTNESDLLQTAQHVLGKAKIAYLRAIAQDPLCAEARINLGYTLQELGDLRGAYRAFSAAICIQPQSCNALEGRAMLQLRRGKIDSAFADMSLSMETSNCLSRMGTCGKGNMSSKSDTKTNSRGGFSKVVTRTKDADQVDVRHAAQSFTLRALVFEARSDMVSAMRDYRAAVQINPECVHAKYNLGSICLTQQRPVEALQLLDEVVHACPDDPLARTNRGIARLALGETQLALEDLDYAVELAPRSVHALYNRAIVLEGLGETRAATEDFNAALKLEPTNPTLYILRGRNLKSRGRTNEALVDFSTALYLDQSVEFDILN